MTVPAAAYALHWWKMEYCQRHSRRRERERQDRNTLSRLLLFSNLTSPPHHHNRLQHRHPPSPRQDLPLCTTLTSTANEAAKPNNQVFLFFSICLQMTGLPSHSPLFSQLHLLFSFLLKKTIVYLSKHNIPFKKLKLIYIKIY